MALPLHLDDGFERMIVCGSGVQLLAWLRCARLRPSSSVSSQLLVASESSDRFSLFTVRRDRAERARETEFVAGFEEAPPSELDRVSTGRAPRRGLSTTRCSTLVETETTPRLVDPDASAGRRWSIVTRRGLSAGANVAMPLPVRFATRLARLVRHVANLGGGGRPGRATAQRRPA